MPSIAEFEEINSALKASLSRGKKELDQNVASAAQRLLLQKIEFKPADKPHTLQLSSLKSKYILLQRSKKEDAKVEGSKPKLHIPISGSEHATSGTMNGPGSSGDAGDSLPSPRVVIYPPERIKLEWRQVHKIGAGLINLGNTCFMNSTLQCLTYTAPLVNYCFSEEHPNTCKQQNFCLMCELRRHIRMALHNGCGAPIKPHSILQRMKSIAKHFKYGKQEDAHEFLRYMVDGLQRACLNGYAKLDKFSKETTVINQIFGGFLRSQVQCMKCSARSNTYDPFMDLSLDIRGVYTMEDALAKYVKTETLDSDNAYKCEKCHQKVPAQKRFSIHKTPNVLTIQLNRFDYNRMAGKINRHIQFPEKLNIRPYMSQKQGEPVYYHLYGVLIHQGNHCSMGHYYCYVKAPSNVWYVMNDSMVHTVSPSRVYQAEAYVLFYSKVVQNQHQTSTKTPFIGPLVNGVVTPKFNGAFGKQQAGGGGSKSVNNEVGVPVPRQMLSPVKGPQTSTATSSSSVEAAPSLLHKHKKISFGLSTPKPFHPVQNQMPQPKQRQDGSGSENTVTSPRIVMQIKNGKVTTIEKSPDGKSKVVKGSAGKQSTLVPYDYDDSDSGGEGMSKDHDRKSNENKGPRVALNFRDQEKENHVGTKVSKFSQSAFAVFPGSSSSAKSSPRKERVDSFAEGNHRTGGVKTPGCDLTLGLNKDGGSSGVKRMSIDTHSPTKVNSTTSWFVQTKDSAPSPSLGSCSSNNSNHSVNSTTEWTVVEAEGKSKGASCMDKKPPLVPFTGWKVTNSPASDKRSRLVRSESLEEVTCAKRFKRSASLEPLLEHKPKLKLKEKYHSNLESYSPRTLLKKTDRSSAEPLSRRASVEASPGRACKTEVSSSSEVGLIMLPVSDPQSGVKAKGEASSRVEVAPCSRDSVEDSVQHNGQDRHSDTQPLLMAEDPLSPSEKTHKKHKKKKHKKEREKNSEHERERSKVKYSELEESVTSEDGHSRRKHKKKKHKRNHYDSDDSDGRSARKRRKSESSDSEYMWEERTKETLLREKSEKSRRSSVPTISWNHYLEEGRGSKQDSSQAYRAAWDGSKKSQVADELRKKPTVMTWGGERSQADVEAEREEKQRNRKTWSQRYEEDIDRGKTKKAKRKAEECPWSFNPFQKFQNHQNQEKSRWKSDYSYKPQSFGSSSVPSLGHSQSDPSAYRHNGGSHHHHRDYHSRNSNGNGYHGFHRSYSHQGYHKSY